MVFLIFQALLILVLPFLLTRLTERFGTANWLSPVVLCYLAGILLKNLTPLPLDAKISTTFSQGAIVFAIPLLLYSTDLLGWLKLAKGTLISFALVVVSVLISTVTMAWLFKNLLADTWLLSGMLTGVFIGGTQNMNAIGIALEASDETFIALNAVEIACGGAFLLFLTSVAPRFFGLFLPEFQGDKHAGVDEFLPANGFNWKDIALAMGLTLLIIGAAITLVWLATGSIERPGLLILLLSAASIVASFFPAIRNLGGSYETGEYCLLMFSIAIGMLADFGEIFSKGGWLLAFTASTLIASVGLHLLLCRLFKIDRDTMMITNTAAIYGPPFIGQVAAVIKNRSLVFSGIATGLVGIALANFAGVIVAKILKMWLVK